MTVLALALPISAQANALFGNDMAGDRKLPRTWGIGIDYFSMDHALPDRRPVVLSAGSSDHGSQPSRRQQ